MKYQNYFEDYTYLNIEESIEFAWVLRSKSRILPRKSLYNSPLKDYILVVVARN